MVAEADEVRYCCYLVEWGLPPPPPPLEGALLFSAAAATLAFCCNCNYCCFWMRRSPAEWTSELFAPAPAAPAEVLVAVPFLVSWVGECWEW